MSAFLAAHLALRAKILSLDGLPELIGWPNIVFNPEPDRLHVRVYDIPSGSESLGVGVQAGELDSGIWQVSIFEQPGKDIGDALALADAIKAHFKRARLVSGTTVVQCGEPRRGPSINEDQWCQIPVSIPYSVITP